MSIWSGELAVYERIQHLVSPHVDISLTIPYTFPVCIPSQLEERQDNVVHPCMFYLPHGRFPQFL
jgi:hypothetical protein